MTRDISPELKLLEAAEEGNLESLECPTCKRPSVSVSFTHPTEDEYRVWFSCAECSFSLRVQHRGRPRHYSEARVDPERQQYDIELLRKLKFGVH